MLPAIRAMAKADQDPRYQEQGANQQLDGKIKEENSLQELQCNCISLCSPRTGNLPEK